MRRRRVITANLRNLWSLGGQTPERVCGREGYATVNALTAALSISGQDLPHRNENAIARHSDGVLAGIVFVNRLDAGSRHLRQA
jgi:hypothetical protein